MPLSVEQQRTVPTRAQVLDFLLSKLGTLGFNVTAWQSGSPQRTLLLGISWVASDFAEVVKQIAEAGFLATATGAALEEFAISRFDEEPKPGEKTVGPLRLTNSGAIPHTLAVGQLLLATPIGDIEFRLTALPNGATLSAGGTLDVTVTAVKVGVSGNVAADTITVMKTPLAGVTCSNPSPGGGQPWYTTAGADPESDAALRERCRTKWARLSIELIRDAYINIALNSHSTIRRCEVDDQNPRGAGTIDVYIASDSGPVGPAVEQASQNYFAARTLQTDTYPPTASSRVHVLSVSALSMDVSGTVYYAASSSLATVQAAVEAAIAAFFRNVPIGGYPYPSPGNMLPKNELENAIRQVSGVKTVSLSAPVGDTSLGSFQVPIVGSLTGLTYSAVAG